MYWEYILLYQCDSGKDLKKSGIVFAENYFDAIQKIINAYGEELIIAINYLRPLPNDSVYEFNDIDTTFSIKIEEVIN